MTWPESPRTDGDVPRVDGARLRLVDMTRLPGWSGDDHAAALAALCASAAAVIGALPPLRAGVDRPAALLAALAEAPDVPGAQAARFFERQFTAFEVLPEEAEGGFFTGYFEPELAGADRPDARFATPVLDRPPDLVTFAPGETPAGFEGLAAARRQPDGTLTPYPERAAIETGALAAFGLERLWVESPVDLFFMQVQGSGRVRLPDGRVVRLVYAGRNGQPYTPVGRIVADALGIPRSEMTADRLRSHLDADIERAVRFIRHNRSYVFFRVETGFDPAAGPIGGEGVPLAAGRSIAVDRSIWPYGLPVFVDVDVPTPDHAATPWRRLCVAQDTGSAILGPARADLFFGSGPAAGLAAGRVRHAGRFIVLWPKARA